VSAGAWLPGCLPTSAPESVSVQCSTDPYRRCHPLLLPLAPQAEVGASACCPSL
jgi:hypothetical protein